MPVGAPGIIPAIPGVVIPRVPNPGVHTQIVIVDDRPAVLILVRFGMRIAEGFVIERFFSIHSTINVVAAESAGIAVYDYTGFTVQRLVIRNEFDDFTVFEGINPLLRSVPFRG